MGVMDMKMKEKHSLCGEIDSGTRYKIGMFAAMNRVTVKTLRFYEEQGLLTPDSIDTETGYRYYTLNQMAILHQIQALKQAGFTLEEIARMNNGADKEVVLLQRKTKLLTKIAELTKQVAILEGYLAKENANLQNPVLIKTVPECIVAYTSVRLESYDTLFEKMPQMGVLLEEAGCVCSLPEYCFTNYLDYESQEETYAELCEAIVGAGQEVSNLKFKTFPEITAACIFHKGSYNTLPEAYENIFSFIEENDYKIVGGIRESYIDGVWNKEDESDWLTEIQIPVKKNVL